LRDQSDIIEHASRKQYPYWQHWVLKPGQMVLAGVVERQDVDRIKKEGETLRELLVRLVEAAQEGTR